MTPPTNMVLWLPFDETGGPISANIAPVLGANSGIQVGGPSVVFGRLRGQQPQFQWLAVCERGRLPGD